MNNFKRGQSVLVLDFQGIKHPKKVWQDLGQTVVITSDSNFKSLKKGVCEAWPIGVPRETVTALSAY